MAAKDIKRKLTAIFSADVKDYSRLMEDNETETVQTINEYREMVTGRIEEYKGKVVDAKGDNILAEFPSVVNAVECGVKIQRELKERNADLPERRRMEFRIGINLGDVIEDAGTIYGDGVNIAARLESLADGCGMCVSGTAYDQIGKKLPLGYEYLGEQTVKNIAKPIRVYRVLMEPEAAGKVIGEKNVAMRQWKLAAVSTIVVILIAVITWYLFLRQDLPKIEAASIENMAYELPEEPSIAVLPFKNLSSEKEEEFLADGITENIITALSKTPKMFVIASNSVFTYKGKPVKVQQVAEEMGVRYVLEGSLQVSDDRLRINAQLIDAIEGNHLWAERYDREIKDIFDLQDEVTIKTITALRVKLTKGEAAHVSARSAKNLQAYLKLLEAGEYQKRFTKEGMILSRKALKEAIELDPEYGQLYVLMGWNHLHDAHFGWSKPREKGFKLAYELAQKALTLNADKSGVYLLLSGIHLRKGEIKETIALREKAVALEPNNSRFIGQLAVALTSGGKPEEAIKNFKKAIRLDPFTPAWLYHFLGNTYRLTEQNEKAIEAFKTAIIRNHDFWLSHFALAACYGLLGREDEAHASAAEVLRIRPNFSLVKLRGFTYKDKADKERCLEVLRKAGLPD